jgi:tRNA A37 N6-isopentenylltransferase MiaA
LDRGYDWELPAMSGLGYIQFRPYLAGETTLEEAVERVKLETHDFIRRQYTWFRPPSGPPPSGLPLGGGIHWLNAADPHLLQEAHALVDAFLNAAGTTS